MALDQTIQVGGKTYKPTIFAIQAQAAYAKSLIFVAEASVAARSQEYIWAAIASYYSLFHLSIFLMFVAPQLIESKLLVRLVKGRAEGVDDPTGLIPHSYLPRFLANCETRGLTPRVRELIETAKNIREEYANYGPRIAWRDEKPIFRTRGYAPVDVRRVTTSIAPLLRKCLLWAWKQHDSSHIIAGAAAISLDWFLSKTDLLYAKWCPPEVLAEAKKIRHTLPFSIIDGPNPALHRTANKRRAGELNRVRRHPT